MKISVIVHPNSKKERIEKDLFRTLHIFVKAPPLEGKANKATIAALADYFKTSKAQVQLISGFKSKQKVFEVS